MSNHYDAFISYKHADLDIFVADTVQKELERFKLPRRVTRNKAESKKRKIDRIFRDKDELALASDLSEPIYDALKSSEYLIVICTPRVCESKWCKKEISLFIQEHGRERVLAVLAEGEPEEAFPEEIRKKKITVENEDGTVTEQVIDVEPLAADVRGKDKKEVKKMIRQELLRIAAVMFDCNYEDLRQRRREEKIRKNVIGACYIMAFFALFGIYALAQTSKLMKQANQLAVQYAENLTKEAELISNEAENALAEGNVKTAINDCLTAGEGEQIDMPEEGEDYIWKTLVDCIGIYKSSSSLRAVNSVMIGSNVFDLDISDDSKYLIASAQDNFIYVVDIENSRWIYQFKCLYSDSNEFLTSGDSLLVYKSGEGLQIINLLDSSVIKNYEDMEVKSIANVDGESFVVITDEGIMHISSTTGEILDQLEDDRFANAEDCKCRMCDDKDKMFIDYRLEDEDNQDQYINYVLSVSLDNLSVVGCTSIEEDNIYAEICANDTLYLSMLDSDYVENSPYVYTVKFGSDDCGKIEIGDHNIVTFYKSGDYVIIDDASNLIFIDVNKNKICHEYQFSDIICNVDIRNDQVYVYMENGVCEKAYIEEFYFSNETSQSLPSGSYGAILTVGNKLIVYCDDKNYISIYSNEMTEYAELTDKELDFFENIYEKTGLVADEYKTVNGRYRAVHEGDAVNIYEGDSVIGTYNLPADDDLEFAVSEDGKYFFLKDYSGVVEIFSIGGEYLNCIATCDMSNALSSVQEFGDYYVIANYEVGYVFSKKTNVCVAEIDGYVGYDSDENCVYISCNTDLEDGEWTNLIYKIPFMSYYDVRSIASTIEDE